MTYGKYNFILLAAGKSTRFGRKLNKSKLSFRNKPLIENALNTLKLLGFSNITIIYKKSDKAYFKKYEDRSFLIQGGSERSESVKNGILENPKKFKYTIIHDLARPIINEQTVLKIIKFLETGYECVVPYSKVTDTIIKKDNSIKRENLKLLKTPQGFLSSTIKKLHSLNVDKNINDDSELFRKYQKNKLIKYFEEKDENFKITFKQDLEKLEYLEFKNIKYGIGYDIHRIKKMDTKQFMVLGGVKIKSYYKIIAHSDGDVILHSITDALLGAMSKRDIGVFFPNTKINQNRDSMDFFLFALNKMRKQSFFLGNIDIMVVSEKPKINLNYNNIILNLCKIIGIARSEITLKATSNEGSGLIGQEKFIAVWSSVLIKKII